MTSNVSNYTQNINTNFPVQGQDNPSQGFRDNFAQIALALDTAAQEISAVQIAAAATDNPYILPVASSSVLGGVKVGTGITIANGIISADAVTYTYTLPTASNTILGGVKVGTGISLAGDGTISVNIPTPYTLPTASNTTLGGVKVGTGISLAGDGTISVNIPTPYTLPTASNTTLGGVKVDGTTVTINGSGVISAASAYTLPTASNTILGGVKVGAGLAILAGVVSVDNSVMAYPVATGSSGQALITDGANSLSWANLFPSRTSVSATTAPIANGATGNISITGFKSYLLQKVQTNTASWVRLYTTAAARIADAGRAQGTDPLPGSGVIAEIITLATGTVVMSPGVFGFNDETLATNNIQCAVTNNSGGAAAITVTLTLVQLEN